MIKSAYSFLRNIYKIRQYISESTATKIVNAFIFSKLDYCNTLYYGCHNYVKQKLQRIQNASVRFIKRLNRRTSITDELNKLHFLPINKRISFRLCCYVHKCIYGQAPHYMKLLLNRAASAELRIALRSQDSIRLYQPLTRKISSFSTTNNQIIFVTHKTSTNLNAILKLNIFQFNLNLFI